MLNDLSTEMRNPRTTSLDEMSPEDILKIMNEEDAGVIEAVKEQIPQIAKAVKRIEQAFHVGGRLIYLGAGTSGRIGLLDAVECPPTFGTDPNEVIGIIAGGETAFIKAVEGAEDNQELAVEDLKRIHLSNKDIVVGLAASGRTPYVIGGMVYAGSMGATTISVSCNKNSAVSQHVQIPIEVNTGPEVLTGSTRLKAGTAQKMVCNMLSTTSMIRIGKAYSNLMVDLQPTNEKLIDRAIRIMMEATDCNVQTASHYLEMAQGKPKIAIIMFLTGITFEEANERLKNSDGFIHNAIKLSVI
jgi:N-acetylmuramic acid 6-phosphate etherase